MNIQKSLNDLQVMSKIRPLARIIYHKAEELKELYADEITQYLDIKKNFSQEVYGHIRLLEEDNPVTNQSFLFELDRNDDNHWILTDIEPHPSEGFTPDFIMPQEVIQFITSFKPNPQRIEGFPRFTTPSLNGRSFNLRFVKYSEEHALGTICENIEKKFLEKTPHVYLHIDDGYRKYSSEGQFHDLKRYMEKYPLFKEHVMSDFYMKWKPLLDQKIIGLP